MGRKALEKGAIGFAKKPVSLKDLENAIQKMDQLRNSTEKELLIIGNEAQMNEVKNLLENKEVSISTAANGKEALNLLKAHIFDCVVLDPHMADMSVSEFLAQLETLQTEKMSIIVYAGKEVSKKEMKVLSAFTEKILIKTAATPELLLDEVSLFLHSALSQFSPDQKKIMKELHDPKRVLKNRKLLLVDDDERNSYALSKALTDSGMKIVVAENGKMAIDKLEKEKDIDIVLMDVMMPIMDGYEATTRIRKNPAFNDLPIISLTAKAMPEDRAKSLEAGANDYLPKPILHHDLVERRVGSRGRFEHVSGEELAVQRPVLGGEVPQRPAALLHDRGDQRPLRGRTGDQRLPETDHGGDQRAGADRRQERAQRSLIHCAGNGQTAAGSNDEGQQEQTCSGPEQLL